MTMVGSIDFNTAGMLIGAFGLARIGSTALGEIRMLEISKLIN